MSRVFATQIPINKNVTLEELVNLAKVWLTKSPHNALNEEEIIFDENGVFEKEGISLKSISYKDEHVNGGSVKIERTVEESTWTTEVSFKNNDRGILTVINSISNPLGKRPPLAKKPRIIDLIIKKNFQDYDNVFLIKDKEHEIKKDDVEFIAPIFTGKEKTILPIVYLSKPRKLFSSVLPDFLARRLAGIAHVLVEDSIETSFALSELAPNKPYGGTIGIIWPGNTYVERIFPLDLKSRALRNLRQEECRRYSQGEINKEQDNIIARRIISGLKHIHIPEDLTYSGINRVIKRQNLVRDLKELRNNPSDKNNELLEQRILEYNQLLAIQDEEIEEKNQEILDLKQRVLVMEAIQGNDCDTPFYQQHSFTELYEGEVLDIVKSALEKYKENSTGHTRRLKILETLCQSDVFIESRRDHILQAIQNIFNGYTRLDAKARKQLLDLGFEVKDDSKHYKLQHRNSNEQTIFAKTPSDHRSGKNIYSEIKKQFF